MRKTGGTLCITYIPFKRVIFFRKLASVICWSSSIQYASMTDGMHTLTTQESVVQYLVLPYMILSNLDCRYMDVQAGEARRHHWQSALSASVTIGHSA